MRILHLMVLVLYAAIILALLTPAIRTSGTNQGAIWILTALGVPWAMAWLTRFLVLPGPHRDWVHALFMVLGTAVTAGLLTMSLMFQGLAPPPRLAGTWAVPLAWTLLVMILAGGWLSVIGSISSYLLPSRCPHCRRRRLIRAIPYAEDRRRRRLAGSAASPEESRKRRRSERFSFFRCGSCHSEALLSLAQARQGCPNCGRHPLCVVFRTKNGVRLPWGPYRYTYYWCLACRRRSKSVLPGTWEDATNADDDAHYWLRWF